jgi:hypothetical protein
VGNGNSTFEAGEASAFRHALPWRDIEDDSYTDNNVYWLSAGGAPAAHEHAPSQSAGRV